MSGRAGQWTITIKSRDGKRKSLGRLYKTQAEALQYEYELKQACPELEPKAERLEG